MKKYIVQMAVLLAALMPVAAQAVDTVTYKLQLAPKYIKDGYTLYGSPLFVRHSKGAFGPSDTLTYKAPKGAPGPSDVFSCDMSIGLPEIKGCYAESWSIYYTKSGTDYTLESYSGEAVTISFPYDWYRLKGCTDLRLLVSIAQKKYTITYDENGGDWASGQPSGGTFLYGAGAKTPPKSCATRAGHTFTGWNTAPDGSGKSLGFGETFTGETFGITEKETDITLYAQWTANTYKVTLNKNGGTCEDLTSYTYGVGATLPNATKTGCTFGGWYADSSFAGSKVTEISKTDTGDKEFWAKFTADGITVKYEGNGSTGGGTSPSSFTYDVPGTIAVNGFTREFTVTYNPNSGSVTPSSDKTESTFSKWCDTASGKAAYEYASGQSNVVNPCGATGGTVTLYARWEDGLVTLPEPSRSGYTFKGWYTAASGGERVGGAGEKYGPISANKTIYAQWEANTYKVTLNKNGGTCEDLTSYTYGVGATLPNATKTGCTFGGWYADSSFAGSKVTEISKTDTGDKEFWAKFTADGITVKYEGNGSTGGGTSPSSFTYDVPGTIAVNGFTREFTVTYNPNSGSVTPSSDKTESTFVNWCDTASGKAAYEYVSGQSNVVNPCGATGGTVTLYARWEDGSVTLPEPSRSGYAFKGWYTASSGGERVGGAGEKYGPISANKTIYAHWTADTYKVTLNKNGGTCEDLTSYTYGVGATLPTSVTKTECKFGGWYADSSFAGSKVTEISKTDTGDKEFWAKFTTNQYTITTGVTPEGSGSVSGGGTHTYGTEISLTANPNKGYGFQQWQDGNTDNPRKITVTSAATYTATFQTQGYTATIAKGEKGSGGCQIGYDYSESQQTKTIQSMPTRRGHSISGWTATGYSGSAPTISDTTLTIPAKTSGDFTMTPTWKANTITVQYKGNGNTSGSTSQSTFTYDVEGELRENGFAKSYTVTYYANGGSVSPSSDKADYTFQNWNDKEDGTGGYTYKNGATVTNPCDAESGTVKLYAQWDKSVFVSLPTPTWTGHSFSGWYTAQTGGDYIGKGGEQYVPEKSISLYAHWDVNKCTVTFDANGGTCSEKSRSVEYGNVIGALPTPTYGARAFKGWFDDRVAGAQITQNTTVKNDMTIYAHWGEAQKFTITAVANPEKGGTVTGGGEYELGEAATLSATAKTGYTFKGWAHGETAATFTTNVVADAKYTANFEANKYTLVFIGNGGTVPAGKDTKTITYDQPYGEMPTPTPGTAGLTFVGWFDAQTGGNAVKPTDVVKKTDAVQLLYAHWSTVTYYFVAFDGNGATGGTPMEPQKMNVGEATALKPNTYEWEGYNFAGWTNSVGTAYADGQEVTDLAEPGQTNTLYAVWTPWKNYVKFDGNGKTGGEMAVQEFEYGVTNALTKNGFKKKDFTFQGWTNETAQTFYADEQKVAFCDPDNTTNTLTAVWTVNTYTMHFEPNATTVLNPTAQPDISNCVSGVGVKLPKCQYINLPSCGFIGWVDENSVTNQAGTTVTHTVAKSGETVTYNAAWQDSGPLSKAVGLDGIAALTNHTESITQKWKPYEEGENTCIRHFLPDSKLTTCMSMLVKGPGTLTFKYKGENVVAVDTLKLKIDGEYQPPLPKVKTTYQSYTNKVEIGIHAITWECSTPGSTKEGAFYIDDVTWKPEGGKSKPLIFFIR